jgi:hypothetical protein
MGGYWCCGVDPLASVSFVCLLAWVTGSAGGASLEPQKVSYYFELELWREESVVGCV